MIGQYNSTIYSNSHDSSMRKCMVFCVNNSLTIGYYSCKLCSVWVEYKNNVLIMPRAELPRYTVIVLSVRPSVCLSVFYKHFSSLAKN